MNFNQAKERTRQDIERIKEEKPCIEPQEAETLSVFLWNMWTHCSVCTYRFGCAQIFLDNASKKIIPKLTKDKLLALIERFMPATAKALKIMDFDDSDVVFIVDTVFRRLAGRLTKEKVDELFEVALPEVLTLLDMIELKDDEIIDSVIEVFERCTLDKENGYVWKIPVTAEN